jgi:hypothetical protein
MFNTFEKVIQIEYFRYSFVGQLEVSDKKNVLLLLSLNTLNSKF